MDAKNKGEAIGQVIVFIGPGKGKTTAAVGTALRTIDAGGKVIFVYFTGPQHPKLGEVNIANAIRINWRMIGIKSESKDPSYLDEFYESVDTVKEALKLARTIWSYECELLILDNITHHLASGSIDDTQLIALIDNRPPNTSIILTGPSAPDWLIEKADVVTEFLKIKQSPDTDMRLRQGINF